MDDYSGQKYNAGGLRMNGMDMLQQTIDSEVSVINKLLDAHTVSTGQSNDTAMEEFFKKMEDVNKKIIIIKNRFK